MICAAILTVFITTASFAQKYVAEGKSFTAFGAFKIEKADKPLVIGGVPLDTYLITYENSGLNVTVAIEQTEKCKRYITLSDRLSVQYVCYGTHFGVEKLSHKYSHAGYKTSDAALEKSSYFHQKVLTRGEKDEVTCMMLIGAYFPELMSDSKGIVALR